MRFVKGLAISLFLSSLLFVTGFTGCKDPYGACVRTDADIAKAVSSGFVEVTQLQQQGLITTAEAINVAGFFKIINDSDKTFGTCISAAHTSKAAGAFTACAAAVNTTLNTPAELALAHVNDSNASATISAIIQSIIAGVNTLNVALGGA